MKIKLTTVYLVLVLGAITFSCLNGAKDPKPTIESPQLTTEENENHNNSSQYIEESELIKFLRDCPTNNIQQSYPSPFDTISFDKVIAYDFDGSSEMHQTVFDTKKNGFSPFVTKQVTLNSRAIEELTTLVTDKSTYGEEISACFEPHLGFVFFEGLKAKVVINVCLDCNYLTSTIPLSFQDDNIVDEYPNGFSNKGIDRIINLSAQLELNYGNYKK